VYIRMIFLAWHRMPFRVGRSKQLGMYSKRMEELLCKHSHSSSCDSVCECWCDVCQKNYENEWVERAEKDNLCDACGVPKNITIESVFNFQYIHFFQPCPSCVSGMNACLAAANLCEACREPLVSGDCSKCKCLETEDCECRQCRAFRNADSLPQSGGDVEKQSE
jgi:hypothetical protein